MNKLDLDTLREEQLAKLRRHVQLAPQDPEIRFVLAKELVQHNYLDAAATELHIVIALVPNHLEARKLLELLAKGSPL